jgi:hypothetical protein
MEITDQQLADYLYGEGASTGQLPADWSRLLARASELIADSTVTAVYSTDVNGDAIDLPVITGFRKATCAQVEFWLAGDEEDDISGPLQGMSVGGQQQQYGAGNNRATPMYLAPRAARALRVAGLLDAGVYSL